jgi:hypothetical protein
MIVLYIKSLFANDNLDFLPISQYKCVTFRSIVSKMNFNFWKISVDLERERSRDSVIGITTGYGMDDRGVGSSSPGRVKNFLLCTSSRPALKPTQPPIHWIPGILSSEVKPPGREADHSPPPSAEVKKMWIYTSTPIALAAMWCPVLPEQRTAIWITLPANITETDRAHGQYKRDEIYKNFNSLLKGRGSMPRLRKLLVWSP